MGSGENTFMDESVSTVVDPVGEETGELSSDDSSSLCNHCSESNSGFRIGFKYRTKIVMSEETHQILSLNQ
jgi:hypothetical protein